MIPRKAILAGVVIAFLGKFLLIAFFGFMQDPETEPGAAATAFSWTLGTVVRAAGGYVAARMSVGLPVWTAQAALGGGLAVVLHRKRITSKAQTSAWAYG